MNLTSIKTNYYPFGKVLREYVNGDKERYLTTQHERDNETGLDYRGARYYDSDVARFLSLDPLASDYPSWSDYNYVMGNPIVFVDPDGKAVRTAGNKNPSVQEIYIYCTILSREYDIDKRVLFLLLYKESTFNQFKNDKVNVSGSDYGISQINSWWHGRSIRGVDIDKQKISTDWKNNVKVGMLIFLEEIEVIRLRRPDLKGRAFDQKSYQMYNGSRDELFLESGKAFENAVGFIKSLSGLLGFLQVKMDNLNNQISNIYDSVNNIQASNMSKHEKVTKINELAKVLKELQRSRLRLRMAIDDMNVLKNEWNGVD